MGGGVQRYRKMDNGEWIETGGLVRKLLPDDISPSPHQRFILDLRNGQTVLVAHKLGLAVRGPLGIGDRVRVRGMYEWNDRGGLVHWTHGDPMGIDDGGYIKYRTKLYQ